MSSDTTSGFAERLRRTQERYRRQNLETRLAELAEEMELTLLHRAFAEAFLNAENDSSTDEEASSDSAFRIDPDAQAAVRKVRRYLQDGAYNQLGDQWEELEAEVTDARRRVENEVQPRRLDALDRVRAMQRLNERVERVDPERLAALETLLDDWNWRAHVEVGADDFGDALAEAEDVGAEFRGHFEEFQDELFGPYRGTDVWPIVQRLLDEERLTYGDLTEEERDLLAESDLAAYVELSLS